MILVKKASIDRIFENYATCEDFDGITFLIDIKNLPKNIKEGDIINISGNKITVDALETQKRRDILIKLQNEIFNK